VGGGGNNQAGDNAGTTGDAIYATAGGGHSNEATGNYATVGGGNDNTANGAGATVGGGTANTAFDRWATVAGGVFNTASGNRATVGGGDGNEALADYATVGGGSGNEASGHHATVGGGSGNEASGGNATVGGGHQNSASGAEATIPGGGGNIAQGAFSFAAGRDARANHDGAFVWSDSVGIPYGSNANNQFRARASGGVYFHSNASATTGVHLPPGGGSWSSVSDRNLKENLAPVDEEAILTRLAEIPITTWNYKAQDPTIRHIGPMAQDFHAAFGVGEDQLHISSADADGVALAAIQGLYQIMQEKNAQIATQQQQIAHLETRLAALEQQMSPRPLQSGLLTSNWGVLGLGLVGLIVGLRTRRGDEQ
jgi:hypothetical protein